MAVAHIGNAAAVGFVRVITMSDVPITTSSVQLISMY